MISLLALIVILLLIGGGIWGWPLVAGALGISSVTDKPGALKYITQLMITYDITPTEVETAFQASISASSATTRRSKGDIAKTLFAYLGAIFILAGISTYIGMFWNNMGSVMRVFVTLGVGYVLLIVLVSALHENKFPRLILPLTLACVFMMTGGWFVLIHEVYPQGDNWRAAVLFVFGMMALHQGVLFGKYQRTALAFTALFFVYGFLDVGLDMLGVPLAYVAIVLGASVFLVGTALEKTSHRILTEPALLIGICWMNGGIFDRIAVFTSPNWASLITGVCLIFTAYGMNKAGRYLRLIALGYFIGSIMAYSGLFDLVENTPVELLFLAVTASILYACVVLQSRALLLTTVIAMLAFIGYFSEKHFANSLGWPITLVLIGIAFLGVGAIAIKVKQRI
ncbi:MAG: DUF2157 domain-containing protein [Proteobacteria bacterium]|nr:DUF2157 domain-containing protein [Pseudomonadota bacterium]MBU1716485.1 DUF2157 domain-containing protein [Pseudomonadota bacterium]